MCGFADELIQTISSLRWLSAKEKQPLLHRAFTLKAEAGLAWPGPWWRGQLRTNLLSRLVWQGTAMWRRSQRPLQLKLKLVDAIEG